MHTYTPFWCGNFQSYIKEFIVGPILVLFKVWSTEQQYQHHLLFIRNADAQALSQIEWIRICILAQSSSHSHRRSFQPLDFAGTLQSSWIWDWTKALQPSSMHCGNARAKESIPRQWWRGHFWWASLPFCIIKTSIAFFKMVTFSMKAFLIHPPILKTFCMCISVY